MAIVCESRLTGTWQPQAIRLSWQSLLDWFEKKEWKT